jgi:hypothetical protein
MIKLIEKGNRLFIEYNGVRSCFNYSFNVIGDLVYIQHKGFSEVIQGELSDFIDEEDEPFADLDTIEILLAQYQGFNTAGGGSSAWGGIIGDLNDQIDLKAALDAKSDHLTPFKQNTPSSLTGTTLEAVVGAPILIPAGTFQANDWLRWGASINATANNHSKTLKFYFNTSASLSGATQIAQRGLTNAVTQSVIRNMFFVNSISSQKTLVGTVLNVATDEATTGTQATLSIDFSVDQYFIVTGTLAVGTDTITVNGITSNINR